MHRSYVIELFWSAGIITVLVSWPYDSPFKVGAAALGVVALPLEFVKVTEDPRPYIKSDLSKYEPKEQEA